MKKVIFLSLLLTPLLSVFLWAATPLQLPRFASLRSSEINLRVGPGSEYPIEWILKREHMPVEIIAEYEVWRKIRDHEGVEGWVHKSMLSGARFAIVVHTFQHLHRKADLHSKAVAAAEAGVICKIVEAKGDWCCIEAQGYKGWVSRAALWGIYPHETIK
jgi:SH3-like domain-containing protein